MQHSQEYLQKLQDLESWEEAQVKKAQGLINHSIDDKEDFDYVFSDDDEDDDENKEKKIDFISDNDDNDPDVDNDDDDHDNYQNTVTKEQYEDIQNIRKSLPVFKLKEDFLDAIKKYQILIIVGETGSGKTTQLPQYLNEVGYSKLGKIICTQPRRIAAMSVAKRVSEEMNVKLGKEVGYSIRFENKYSKDTIIKYMTDGMLLREFLNDPLLKSYSCIMIDEAHERTLHTDILFGLLKDISKFRPDLRILICSATLNAEKFSTYFNNAPIFNIPGRRYPVNTYYTSQPEADYISATITTILTIHLTLPPGDILVFLTGQDEIEKVEDILIKHCKEAGDKINPLIITPCYANLPADLQSKVFESTPLNSRKVVLATNIAETSITIDGIVYVIDPGFEKQNIFNPKSGIESLEIIPCSKASANQRKGRAGRVSEGKCFRLYTKWKFENELPEENIPEIQRTNMGNTLLLLKSLGINDLMSFDFLDSPPTQALIKALELLYSLGALNDKGELTNLGKKMSEFPLDPMMSKTIINSPNYGCSNEVINIVSMLSIASSLFYRPKKHKEEADKQRYQFYRKGGDHLMLLNIWETWSNSGFTSKWCFENFIQFRSLQRAKLFRDQIILLMKRTKIKNISYYIEQKKNNNEINLDELSEKIRKSFTSGFFPHVARLSKDGESYRILQSKLITYIHPSSSLAPKKQNNNKKNDDDNNNINLNLSLSRMKPKWILYQELILTTKEFMRQNIEIDPKWLIEVAPHLYNSTWLINIEQDILYSGNKRKR